MIHTRWMSAAIRHNVRSFLYFILIYVCCLWLSTYCRRSVSTILPNIIIGNERCCWKAEGAGGISLVGTVGRWHGQPEVREAGQVVAGRGVLRGVGDSEGRRRAGLGANHVEAEGLLHLPWLSHHADFLGECHLDRLSWTHSHIFTTGLHCQVKTSLFKTVTYFITRIELACDYFYLS